MPYPITRLIARSRGRPTRDDVVGLYRIVLGREPESESVINHYAQRPWHEVVKDMLASVEYAEHIGRAASANLLTTVAGFNVVNEAPREELQQLFDASVSYWNSLGRSDSSVYWSVLTEPRWSKNLDGEELRAFYESGRTTVDSILDLVRDVRPDFNLRKARVLDFGCGVGRLLVHLVGRADHVEGWDISRPHLDQLERNLVEMFGLSADCFAVKLIDSLQIAAREPAFDLILSTMALQHNPPPLMRHFVSELLRSLSHRGTAVLHIPTAPLFDHYKLSLQARGQTEMMPMHALAKRAIYRVAEQAGCQIVRSEYSNESSPEFLSETFVFKRSSVDHNGRDAAKHHRL